MNSSIDSTKVRLDCLQKMMTILLMRIQSLFARPWHCNTTFAGLKGKLALSVLVYCNALSQQLAKTDFSAIFILFHMFIL